MFLQAADKETGLDVCNQGFSLLDTLTSATKQHNFTCTFENMASINSFKHSSVSGNITDRTLKE
jgi:hypothetical protein